MKFTNLNKSIKIFPFTLLSICLVLSACAIQAPEGYDFSRGYDQLLDDEMELIHKELIKFESEKQSNCNSHNLIQAESYTEQLENQILTHDIPSDIEFDWNKAIASVTLDVADSALSKDCLSEAESIYRHVIKKYTGFGFSAYRTRATIGLQDIYSRR